MATANAPAPVFSHANTPFELESGLFGSSPKPSTNLSLPPAPFSRFPPCSGRVDFRHPWQGFSNNGSLIFGGSGLPGEL